jgi:ABC-type protease/lipase transport system fused ATPase/permease subunit
MPVTKKNQINVFAIIVLIVSILIFVFLIISAVYYINISNFIYPSQSESAFLFWTTIIFCVIALGIVIYAFYEIYTYKSIVFNAEKHAVVSHSKYNKKPYVQNTIQVKNLQQPSNNLHQEVVKVEKRNSSTLYNDDDHHNYDQYHDDDDHDLDL